MRFDVITLFPDMFGSPLNESILKRAIDEGIIEVGLHNLRDYTHDRHRVVDDAPYGGGSGMVMKAGPVVEAIESLKKEDTKVILMNPAGKRFKQSTAGRFSENKHLLIVCGRYEGFDERVSPYIDEMISMGDYVMTGGEIAAMALIDSVSRLVPGVLGCPESVMEESFSWDILEYPHYTRPDDFRGEKVPQVLLSGNHELIRLWRRKEALRKTMKMRPDLLDGLELNPEDASLIDEIKRGGQ